MTLIEIGMRLIECISGHNSLIGQLSNPLPALEEKSRTQGFLRLIERFSNDCRKTEAKAITPTNHNRSRQRDEPITIPSKAREISRVHGAIGFASHWLKNWRVF